MPVCLGVVRSVLSVSSSLGPFASPGANEKFGCDRQLVDQGEKMEGHDLGA
jgi:hypothetical protein